MFKSSWEVDEKPKTLVINVDKNNDVYNMGSQSHNLLQ